MEATLDILNIALPLAYVALLATYLVRFLKEDSETNWVQGLLWGTVGVHIAFFVLRGIYLGFLPLASQAAFGSLVALGIAGVYGILERSQGQASTGAFFLAPAAIAQTVASVQMGYATKHPILLENPVYGVHVILLVFGFVALAIGCLYAVMYLLMTKQLKARDLGVFFRRLPPLMTLERMAKIGSLIGVGLLTMGLAVGYLLAFSVPEVDLSSPKIIVTDIVLLGYVVGIAVIRLRGLSGVQVSWAAIVWFAVFLLSVGLAPHSFT